MRGSVYEWCAHPIEDDGVGDRVERVVTCTVVGSGVVRGDRLVAVGGYSRGRVLVHTITCRLFPAGGLSHRYAVVVINNLGVDVFVGPEHRKARPSVRRTADLAPHTLPTPLLKF